MKNENQLKNLRIRNKVGVNDFKKFLFELSENTLNNFNPFGKITQKNVDSIVDKELKRKDKIKFFSYLKKNLIAYSFLTKFEKPTKLHNCILGIVIADPGQSKGFGKMICLHMVEYAWRKGFKKIWLTVFFDNVKAINLYKRLGFEIEGIFIDDEISGGKKRDVVSMAIFKNSKNKSKNRKILWKRLE